MYINYPNTLILLNIILKQVYGSDSLIEIRNREWRDRERNKIRDERQRRSDLASGKHDAWDM